MSYEKITFPEGSTFLVTGGAGFIGSNVAEALLKKGYAVRVLDNLSTGHIENIQPFIDGARIGAVAPVGISKEAASFAGCDFTFLKEDIRDLNACLRATEGVDCVINLAAWGSVPRSIEMPLLYEEINIRGTLNMMEASRQNGVKRFAYASSSSVYGDAKELPKREGKEGKPLSPYALTKQVDELYGRMYKELYGLNTYGMRFFNVFGRRQDPNGAYAAVIPKFIKQLLAGEQPTIHGDGRQSRDFTYIDNVIEGCLRCCAASEEAAGTAYNIGAGGREFLIDVYYDITKALGVDIEPLFGPPRAGDIRDSNADITKARENLGYDPSYDFAAGIALAIDWYRENL